MIDCGNGTIEYCEIVFDETESTAYCGSRPYTSSKGEKVTAETNDKHIMKIYFVSGPPDKKSSTTVMMPICTYSVMTEIIS